MADGDPDAGGITKIDMVSVRAVLVVDGQDVAAALAENGIHDPIALPILYGDASFDSTGGIGDGRTPNLIATLEPDADNVADPVATDAQPAPRSAGRQFFDQPSSTSLPTAYGLKPLAPRLPPRS